MSPHAPGRAALLACAAAIAVGCGGPKDPVQALLDDVVAAGEARDAGAVVEHLAEGFEGTGGMRKAEVRATLQRYFAAYQSVDLTLYDLTVEEGHQARFRMDFSGRPRDVGGLAGLLPSTAVYSFELTLADGPDGLLVDRATWEPWTPPASPGS